MEQLDARKIAIRYAKALLEAADEQGQYGEVSQNMFTLQRLYLEVPELNRFFANPAIPDEEKRAVIQEHFQGGLAPLTANLLTLLVDNDRIVLLPELIQAAIDLVHQREGVAQAEVIVPIAMKPGLEQKMKTTLEKLFGYQQVDLNVKVDPGILAGAIIKIGDKIIDGSYHGKLETLRRQVG